MTYLTNSILSVHISTRMLILSQKVIYTLLGKSMQITKETKTTEL